MAPHSSTFAKKIPWTEEPGRLQSMGSLEWDTTERLPFHFSLSCIGGGNGNPLQCSCLENPRDGGARWAAVYGVAQSWTRLKRLSSSSSNPLTQASLVVQMLKSLPAMQETQFDPWVGKIPWRRKCQPTPVFLLGKISWTEEPGGLQCMGSQSETQPEQLIQHSSEYCDMKHVT